MYHQVHLNSHCTYVCNAMKWEVCGVFVTPSHTCTLPPNTLFMCSDQFKSWIVTKQTCTQANVCVPSSTSQFTLHICVQHSEVEGMWHSHTRIMPVVVIPYCTLSDVGVPSSSSQVTLHISVQHGEVEGMWRICHSHTCILPYSLFLSSPWIVSI